MQTSLPRLTLLLATLALCPPPGSHADVIVLKTSETVEGICKELSNDPTRVSLTTASGEIVIPKSRIERITRESLSTGHRRIAEQHLDSGRFAEAIASLEEAQRHQPVDAEATQLLDQARRRIVEIRDASTTRRREEATKRIESVADRIQTRQFDLGRKILDGVEPEVRELPGLEKAWNEAFVALETAWAADCHDRLDSDGAARHYREALKIVPDRQDLRDKMLDLLAKDPKATQEVVEGWSARLKANPSDIVLQRKLADLLLARNRPAEAIPHVRALVESKKFPDLGYERKLEECYRGLANDAIAAQKFGEAVRLLTDLQTALPDADATTLFMADYYDRMSALQPKDVAGRVKLIELLRERGLDTLAREELQSVLETAPTNAEALSLLSAYADEVLKLAEDEFAARRYSMALARTKSMASEFRLLPDIVRKSSELYSKAEIENRRMKAERSAIARDLVAQGDVHSSRAFDYADKMKSSDRKDSVRVIDYRREGIKYAKRAIEYYEEAARIDGTTRSLSGGNVDTKIRDLRTLLGGLTAPPVPFAPYRKSYVKPLK